ncbi:MAG: choice-of-anchor X domain-containing protein [Candidatus Latescibacterota bacterium]
MPLHDDGDGADAVAGDGVCAARFLLPVTCRSWMMA